MWIRISTLVLMAVTLCLVFFTDGGCSASELRSAYLGESVWEEGLSSQEVNQQLREHFVEVIDQLEKKHASSLLTALVRAEATSATRWTKAERRAALIYLAHNRQQQIGRLHTYMNRGRFPLNEGQASSPVPIFVDQNKTHCAVGYLMHSDQRDQEVTSIVKANNLVRILDVNKGSLVQWIRSSGLTQEEAAMIQPSYTIGQDVTFEDLLSADFTSNDITISDASLRATRFNVDLPQTLAGSPETFQTALDRGRALLASNNVVDAAFRQQAGVLFGAGPTNANPFLPSQTTWINLSTSTTDDMFGSLLSTFGASENAELVAIEYTLQSNSERFAEFALTSISGGQAGGSNSAFGEQSGLFLRSEVYSGGSSELAGVVELSTTGRPLANGSNGISSLRGSQSIALDSDSIRVVTYGLGIAPFSTPPDPFLGSAGLSNFFHEFRTVAVPEPSSLGLIGGTSC